MYGAGPGCTSSRIIFFPKSSILLTGRALPPGKEGELVLTTLTNSAYPLLRYRTSDVTALRLEPCLAAGRWPEWTGS